MNDRKTPNPLTSTARRLRDPHADLLRDTRGLRRELAAARETWLAALSLDKKEETLFELEMLLKAIACWGNPRNHPARRPLPRLRDRDFRPHLNVALQCVDRALELCDRLLGPGKAGPGHLRHLPLGFSEEPRAAEAREAQLESPVDALAALRHALATQREVMLGLSGLATVPWRVFYASLQGSLREVARNTYFNPLALLEFRPEYDRVRALEVLECIQFMEHDAAHRLVALAFLGHFRLLRLLQLAQATAVSSAEGATRAWALLAAARAEARALITVLRHRAPSLLGDAIQQHTLRIPAPDLRARFDGLARETDRAARLRGTLDAMGASLWAELRRAFEQRLPPCEPEVDARALGAATTEATAALRDALMANVTGLVRALRGVVEPERVFTDRGARKAGSERLRQSTWAFALVTRAFVLRAREARKADADLWSSGPSLRFVRDYLGYFGAMGRALAWETDYAHADRLSLTLYALADVDWLDGPQLDAAVAECEAFAAWLSDAHEKTSRRDELAGAPFDKRDAAEALRAYMRPEHATG